LDGDFGVAAEFVQLDITKDALKKIIEKNAEGECK
jgi:hypothetical protein